MEGCIKSISERNSIKLLDYNFALYCDSSELLPSDAKSIRNELNYERHE